MQKPAACGVMPMTINERIIQLQEKIERMKQKRNILTKVQIFRFQTFSRKQKQILTWWLPNSPVKDYDGIIADGAIRSGKTVCMSLSFVFWAMESFSGQNFAMCGKTIGSFRRNVLFWLKLMLKSRGYKVADHRADNLVEISRGDVTNYFYIFGGKDQSTGSIAIPMVRITGLRSTGSIRRSGTSERKKLPGYRKMQRRMASSQNSRSCCTSTLLWMTT